MLFSRDLCILVHRKSSLIDDDPLSVTTAPSARWDGPGYPEIDGAAAMTNTMPRGSESVEPSASVTSPGVWQHALRIPSQDQTDSTTGGFLPTYNVLVDGILGGFNVICVYYRLVIGRQHSQVQEPQDVPQIYCPPVQPKPKVALRAQGDPHIVTMVMGTMQVQPGITSNSLLSKEFRADSPRNASTSSRPCSRFDVFLWRANV